MTIYLIVKTHLKTGLQYLCQTKQEPFKYLGSGTYWRRHLKIHGKDIGTHILRECQTKEEVEFWGIHYSILWNVVESTLWANLKSESGDGGSKGGTSRIKTSLTMKGRPAHNKGKKQKHKKHKSRSDMKKSKNYIVYNFIHKNGTIETMTRFDMIKKYTTLHSGDFSALINGKLQSHQGWKLVKQ